MKKAILLSIALGAMTFVMAQNPHRVYKAEMRPVAADRNVIHEATSNQGPVKTPSVTDNVMNISKISMSSSLNLFGVYSMDQRFVTTQPAANMFTYANRAGGVFGNTGNDLKYKFTTNQGAAWDSCVVPAGTGKNFRYPSMVTYNPGTTTDPHDMYGVFSGPITDGSNWTDQYFGSIKLDGTNKDVTYRPNASNIYLNHMNVGLFCSPDGHATVASNKLTGSSSAYVQEGWDVLNGTFNTGTSKFDWQPYVEVKPALLEDGRMDASSVVWNEDGSIGYLLGTAIDADLAYNPYGVEWPVIYKSTDHGATWVKAPAFDFSSITRLKSMLWPTRSDTNLIIPRWYNKWASATNESQNGTIVDKNGNLHIFGLLVSTLSIHPDSLNYFYTAEPQRLFDVYMTNYGSWNANYVDTLQSDVFEATSPDIGWDHQTQITKSPDGSKIFYVWTDTDPIFSSINTNPDIKGMGFDVDQNLTTTVRNFTAETDFWGENLWMRAADKSFYDIANLENVLPLTTSIPGADYQNDPIVHQYVLGASIPDSAFTIYVDVKEAGSLAQNSTVSANYPNPFNGSTQITVNLQKASNVSLAVTSTLGQQVMNVNYGMMNEGVHTLTLNASNLNTGVYFYTVKVNGKSYSHKMVIK